MGPQEKVKMFNKPVGSARKQYSSISMNSFDKI